MGRHQPGLTALAAMLPRSTGSLHNIGILGAVITTGSIRYDLKYDPPQYLNP